jgi:uncharacterized protein
MSTSSLPPIEHLQSQQRFQVVVDGHHCVCDYRIEDGKKPDQRVMAIVHTGVPSAVGGRGIAAELVAAALAWARSQSLKVDPVCSYVAVYMRRHRETQDLLV